MKQISKNRKIVTINKAISKLTGNPDGKAVLPRSKRTFGVPNREAYNYLTQYLPKDSSEATRLLLDIIYEFFQIELSKENHQLAEFPEKSTYDAIYKERMDWYNYLTKLKNNPDTKFSKYFAQNKDNQQIWDKVLKEFHLIDIQYKRENPAEKENLYAGVMGAKNFVDTAKSILESYQKGTKKIIFEKISEIKSQGENLPPPAKKTGNAAPLLQKVADFLNKRKGK